MRFRIAILLAVLVGFVSAAVPVFAHHGNSAYDMSKPCR